MRYLFFVVLFGLSSNLLADQNHFLLRGKVITLPSREPLVNCNIYILELQSGTVTDSSGGFRFLIPEGYYHIRASHVGYRTEIVEVKVTELSSQYMEICLRQEDYKEDEIVVLGDKDMSSVKEHNLENAIINKMPTLYSDVLRSVQLLPGVSNNNELSTSYNVRGGNFDENLIYLNGYEIYRPFLLRVGMEENQSLINPDMVHDLKFYNGSFPVIYGDKMSSALEVEYDKEFNDSINFIVRGDLLNSAVSIKNHIGKLHWTTGLRYAYPGLFLQKLQTDGLYSPAFADVQMLLNYELTQSSSLELFMIYAFNEFKYNPENWEGYFQSDRGYKYSEVSIDYYGSSIYSFHTLLSGLKYIHKFSSDNIFSLSASVYRTKEQEQTDINGNYYYSPDAYHPWLDKEYLKSRFDYSDNAMRLNTFEIKADYQRSFSIHNFNTGAGLRLANMENYLDENHYESGSETLNEVPVVLFNNISYKFNSFYYYLQDNITFSRFQAMLGIRMLYYGYNKEFLASPRVSFFYKAGENVILTAGLGYYYQPPFFYELRNQADPGHILKSQKAIHYSAGIEIRFKGDHRLIFETYYKDLDKVIPYYIEQLKLEYLNNNDLEAYAYGFDVMYKGKLRKNGLDNWFTYSFMNSKERNKADGHTFGRRLLDQRHTFQLFLQDRIPRWKNWQSHLRMTFGSGYLFHYRKLIMNETTGKYEISPTFEDRIVLPFYARADMGLSTTFVFENSRKLVFTIEVQNVFDKYNIAGYSFIQVFKDIRWPITIPQIFSKRFFNLGLEYNF